MGRCPLAGALAVDAIGLGAVGDRSEVFLFGGDAAEKVLQNAAKPLMRLVRFTCSFGKRGKTRGGMILRFPGGRESDSFWECRGPGILTVCRTPS
jgi:hypothetical protein